MTTVEREIAKIPQRVAKGVKWLDKHVPDWRQKVEVRTFDITNSCKCVLGQVFHEDARRMDRSRTQWFFGFNWALSNVISRAYAISCGFDAPVFSDIAVNEEEFWLALQNEWIKELSS